MQMKPAFPFNDFSSKIHFFFKQRIFLSIPLEIILFTYSLLSPSGGKIHLWARALELGAVVACFSVWHPTLSFIFLAYCPGIAFSSPLMSLTRTIRDSLVSVCFASQMVFGMSLGPWLLTSKLFNFLQHRHCEEEEKWENFPSFASWDHSKRGFLTHGWLTGRERTLCFLATSDLNGISGM